MVITTKIAHRGSDDKPLSVIWNQGFLISIFAILCHKKVGGKKSYFAVETFSSKSWDKILN